MRITMAAAVVLLVGGIVMANEELLRLPGGVRIAPGQEHVASFEWSGASDAGVRLSLRCRADSRDSGLHHDLRIYVNGVMVNGFIDRQTTRILNKKSHGFDYPRYGLYTWCNTDEGWVVIRAASFEQASESIYGPDPFRYVLDISDLLRPGANVIRFENTQPRSTATPVIVLDDVSVESTNAMPRAHRPEPLDLPPNAKWSITVNSDGTLRLEVDSFGVTLDSRFINPGGAMTFSRLGGSTVSADTPLVGRWQNGVLTIERRMRLEGDFLVIEDTFAARGQETGNICQYRLSGDGGAFPLARLCGSPYPEVVRLRERGNPTVYGSMRGAGIAMVAESDVLRSHADFLYDERGRIGIDDRRLVVSPGQPYTLRLLLYLHARDDYWAFVNALRGRWRVPRVESPLYAAFVYPDTFDGMSDQALRQYFENANVTAVITGTGIELADRPKERSILGLGLGHHAVAQRRAGWARLAQRIERVAPHVQFLLKVHCYFNIPSEPDDHDRYSDALMRGADGSLLRHDVYGYAFVPTMDNSFGRDWRAMIDRVADEIGVDGFYWDESNGPGLPGSPDATYHMWDGVTADLDEDGRILRKAAMVNLVSQPLRLAVLQDQLAQGRVWCLGGEPDTQALQALPVYWWRECQYHAYYAFAGHLSQAQGYVSGGAEVRQYRDLLACGGLPCRISPKQVSPLLQRIFPFTLEELGDGWLRSRDKLITVKSSSFPWPHTDTPGYVVTFLPDGAMRIDDAQPDAQGALHVEVPAGGIVILER